MVERVKGLADNLALVADHNPKTGVLLKWMGGKMANGPRMSSNLSSSILFCVDVLL